jgi:hypothetical protein
VTSRLAVTLAIAMAAATAAATDPYPTRLGHSGILDVSDGSTAEPGTGSVMGELRLDRAPGLGLGNAGPLPLSFVAGVGGASEIGFAMREWGQPGDPRPSPILFSAGAKWRLLDASGFRPAVAFEATADRVNTHPLGIARLALSTEPVGRIRLAVMAGVESDALKLSALGVNAGLAAAIVHRSDLETALEAVETARGAMFGVAFRWSPAPALGVSLGLSWLPREGGMRFSLGLGVASVPKRRGRAVAPPPAPTLAETEPSKPAGPQFTDDRPHFRMRIASATGAEADRAHDHFAMAPGDRLASVPSRKARIDPVEQRNRELDELSEQLDGRARRLRSADGALTNRQERLAEARRQADAREKQLAARGTQLDVREGAVTAPGKATASELQLAESEDQARTAERDGTLQARKMQEAIDAAAQREHGLVEKEAQLRQPAAEPAPQGEGRQGALAAREAWLAALEARLAATRDRLEAVELQLNADGSRLDAFERRLTLREERLILMEKRGQRPAAGGRP